MSVFVNNRYRDLVLNPPFPVEFEAKDSQDPCSLTTEEFHTGVREGNGANAYEYEDSSRLLRKFSPKGELECVQEMPVGTIVSYEYSAQLDSG